LIVYNPDNQYAANIELAAAPRLIPQRGAATAALEKTATPDAPKCEIVAQQLNRPLSDTVKSIVLATDASDDQGETKLWLLLLRGDHELNEVKTSKLAGFENGYRFATEEEIQDTFGCIPGYLGPINPVKPLSIIADFTVANMSNFICGANTEGFHYTGANWGRDLPEPAAADLRNVVAGDPDPQGGQLSIQRGIEVGHIFFLGDKYSKALGATFLETDGKPAVLQMGCYGIGVSRIAAAAIEQNHDEKGIIWPKAIAPFEVVICPMGFSKSETVRNTVEELYTQLQSESVDVIVDDRDTRPGVMFADWELIGVPLRITIGERGLKDGILEIQGRRDETAAKIPIAEALAYALERLKSM
ncbi:MAG TPA: proline--tRNA ligase, partial [Eoetvoesiella sp.]